MVALNFTNNTDHSKFNGTINYKGLDYNYTIYITPFLNPLEKDEIVSYFGNRTYKGKLCLDTTEEIISNSINDEDVSAFLIVEVNGINNVASGSLQIFNWCDTRKGYNDVWINDVCKIASDDVVLQEKNNPGSTGVPVDVMFILMEQLVAQNLGKSYIKLFVENTPSNPANAAFLVPRYEKIGFRIDKVCGKKHHDDIVMEKKGLYPDQKFINFSFLKEEVIGGKYKKSKTKKRKIMRKRTYKRK